MFNFAALISL